MHASLDWLTAESGPIRQINDLPGRPWIDVALIPYTLMGYSVRTPWRWSQRTIVSVAGTLPMPNVGDAYFWEADASPVTSLRLFEPQNVQWLEGTIAPTTNKQSIFLAKRALESLQAQAAQVVALGLDEARLISMSTNADKMELESIRTKLSKLAEQMDVNRAIMSSNLNQNGFVVFRWSRELESNGKLVFSDYASGNRKKRQAESGFAILSGVKIKALKTGSEWTKNYGTIQRELGYKFPGKVGVVTYLLQAHDVVYVRDLESLRAFSMDVDVGKIAKDIFGGKMDSKALLEMKVVFNIYRAAISQLETFGALNGVKWESLSHTNAPSADGNSESWSTVYAVLTDPKGLTQELPTEPSLDFSWFGMSPIRSRLEDRKMVLDELDYRITNTLRLVKTLQKADLQPAWKELLQICDGFRDIQTSQNPFIKRPVFRLLKYAADLGIETRDAETAFISLRRFALEPPATRDFTAHEAQLAGFREQLKEAKGTLRKSLR